MKHALLIGSANMAVPFASVPPVPVAPAAKANASTKAKTGPKTGAERVAPVIGMISSDVAMPTTTKRGNSAYPFDALTTAGMSFHVANKTAKQMASVVSAQNRKHAQPKTGTDGLPVMRQISVKDADGKVVGKTASDKPETVNTLEFFAVDSATNDADPETTGVRVFRRK